jgi:phosphotransferase system IIB component
MDSIDTKIKKLKKEIKDLIIVNKKFLKPHEGVEGLINLKKDDLKKLEEAAKC